MKKNTKVTTGVGHVRSADKAKEMLPPSRDSNGISTRKGHDTDVKKAIATLPLGAEPVGDGEGYVRDAANAAMMRLPHHLHPIADGAGHDSDADKATGVAPPVRDTITTGRGQLVAAEMAIDRVPPGGEPIASGVGHHDSADKAIFVVPTACDPNGDGLGQSGDADKAPAPLPAHLLHSSDPRIQQIIGLARECAFWLRMRMRNTASLAAEIRGLLQPGRGQAETWGEETKTQALKIVDEAVAYQMRIIENAAAEAAGMKLRKPVAEPAHPIGQMAFVRRTAVSLAEWGLEERAVLDRMEAIARTLPMANFIESRDRLGFTFRALAVLIGHAGHPLDYPKKGHLWKRLGLAPYTKDGVTRAGSTWGRLGGLSKQDWIDLGYKRSRLGDIFGKITQPLFWAQWRKGAPPLGPYGEAYGRYKARQIELNEAGAFAEEVARQVAAAKKAGRKPQPALLKGKLPDSAINARALRYMTKKLVSDLWSEWRRMDHSAAADKARKPLSTAANPVAGEEASGSVPQRGHKGFASSSAPSLAEEAIDPMPRPGHPQVASSASLPSAAQASDVAT